MNSLRDCSLPYNSEGRQSPLEENVYKVWILQIFLADFSGGEHTVHSTGVLNPSLRTLIAC